MSQRIVLTLGIAVSAAVALLLGSSVLAQEDPTPTPPLPDIVDTPLFWDEVGDVVVVGETVRLGAANLHFCAGEVAELGYFGGSGPDLFVSATVEVTGGVIVDLVATAPFENKVAGVRGSCVPGGFLSSDDPEINTLSVVAADTPTPAPPVAGTGADAGGATTPGWLVLLAGAVVVVAAVLGRRLGRRWVASGTETGNR